MPVALNLVWVFLKKAWPVLLAVLLLYGSYAFVDSRGYHRAEREYQAQIDKITAKAAQIEVQAWKQKNDKEEFYVQTAAKADANYTDISSKYSATLLRYAETQRELRARSSYAAAAASQGSDGPSGDPILPQGKPSPITEIVISYIDGEICAQNTARLEAVRQWGLSVLQEQSQTSSKPQEITETK